MHINAETYHTIFLSPQEMGQLRVELAECEELEIDWKKFPALDRLTDAIAHGGRPDTIGDYSNEI